MLKYLDMFKKKPQFKKGPPELLLHSSFIASMRTYNITSGNIRSTLKVKKVELKATRCSINKVEFGNELADNATPEMDIHMISCCPHQKKCAEHVCIMCSLADGNKNGYYVAVTDADEILQLQQKKMLDNIFKNKPQFQKGPREVLLRSKFITYMRSCNKTREQISQTLEGKSVKLLSTICSIKGIEFGADLRHIALEKLRIDMIECSSHPKNCSEMDCIISSVSNGNKKGYHVAIMNEPDTIQQVQRMGNVPVILGNGQQILITKPSDFQKLYAEAEQRRAGRQQQHGGRRGGRAH